MPWYLTRGKRTIKSGNLGGVGGVPDTFCDAYCDTKFIGFIDELTTKLYKVVNKVKDDMATLRDAANGRCANGAILAEITPPKETLGVKREYIIYLERYGPPTNGIFDPALLSSIKAEL